MKTLALSIGAAALTAIGAVVLALTSAAPDAVAQSTSAACVCTPTSLPLGAATGVINNCQCGPMQCVALGSQALVCK